MPLQQVLNRYFSHIISNRNSHELSVSPSGRNFSIADDYVIVTAHCRSSTQTSQCWDPCSRDFCFLFTTTTKATKLRRAATRRPAGHRRHRRHGYPASRGHPTTCCRCCMPCGHRPAWPRSANVSRNSTRSQSDTSTFWNTSRYLKFQFSSRVVCTCVF